MEVHTIIWFTKCVFCERVNDLMSKVRFLCTCMRPCVVHGTFCGRLCDRVFYEMLSVNVYTTCTDGDNTYTCACPAGFTGTNCQLSMSVGVSISIFMHNDDCIKLRNALSHRTL